MNVGAVLRIIQLVIPAIQTAEDFIRGTGRGGEKKEAVLGEFIRKSSEFAKEIKELAGTGQNLKDFNWVKFVLSGPEFLVKVGKIIDAIVDLANFIESFETSQNPPSLEVVN